MNSKNERIRVNIMFDFNSSHLWDSDGQSLSEQDLKKCVPQAQLDDWLEALKVWGHEMEDLAFSLELGAYLPDAENLMGRLDEQGYHLAKELKERTPTLEISYHHEFKNQVSYFFN